MLTVSLVGKKFSCSIQLQITPEKEGGGLELALKAGEKCSNRPQSISNVTASLNISIQRGCSNYVTKCKEMLMFLQEQALPKTMNIMKVHMVNRETKHLQRDESKLFSCIRPAKRDRERARDRSCSRDRLSTRGYCSDSEQVYRHSYAGSTESLTSRTSSKIDILATPRPTRHQLKNAAILRERRQRDASRDRNGMEADREGLSKHQNRSSSIEIQLPTRESRGNKPKRYSLSLETDVESQKNMLTYDGGSESSLRGGIKETGQKEYKMNLIEKSDNKQGVGEEVDSINTVKDPQTNDSDMSVDSLEGLDTTSEDIIKTKIRKKKKWTMKKEKSSTGDIRSNPSAVSIIPALALPEDLHDSPIDYPSNSQLHSDADISHSKRRSISSRGDHDEQTLAAREIVDEVICSALRKCTESISKNTTSYGAKHGEAAATLNGVIDDVKNENRSQSKEKHESEASKVQTEGFASDVTTVTDAINVATQTDQLSGQASEKHTLNNVIANSGESKRKDVITSYRQTSGRLDCTENSQYNERESGNGTLKDARSSPLVKLYDTHENITTRIINSVSLALRLQESYTAPQSASLVFDPRAPCYSAPVELDFRGGMHLTQQRTNYFHKEDLQEKKSAATATPRGPGAEGYRNNCERTRPRRKSEHGSLIAEFCKGLPVRTTYIPNDENIGKNSGYCYFVIGPDSQQDSTGGNIIESPTTNDTHPMIEEPKYAERMRNGKQLKTHMYRRSLYDQNERRRWHASNQIGDEDPVRYSSQETKSARANRCVSCPVLSEEDIVLEGLESHHKDVCNSLSQRTWVILRVHEIWKAKKPLQALTTCMDLTGTKTGALLSSSSTPDLTKDNALFLNILQQLPSSCTAWSLSMCDLLLPELKLLVSKRIHTSHVDMACNVLQVIVKKVSGVVLKVQTGNKEKPDILKNCIFNLREVSQRVSEVLVARRGKAHSNVATEDPIALKPVLRDLSSSIQMLMDVYED